MSYLLPELGERGRRSTRNMEVDKPGVGCSCRSCSMLLHREDTAPHKIKPVKDDRMGGVGVEMGCMKAWRLQQCYLEVSFQARIPHALVLIIGSI